MAVSDIIVETTARIALAGVCAAIPRDREICYPTVHVGNAATLGDTVNVPLGKMNMQVRLCHSTQLTWEIGPGYSQNQVEDLANVHALKMGQFVSDRIEELGQGSILVFGILPAPLPGTAPGVMYMNPFASVRAVLWGDTDSLTFKVLIDTLFGLEKLPQ